MRSRKAERREAWFGLIGRWVGVNVYPATGDRFTVLYEDISDLKRSEAALRESGERKSFLLELSDALRPLVDPAVILAVAARLLGEQLGANQVHYGEVVAETDKEATILVRDGFGNGLPPMVGTFRQGADGWGERLFATYRAGHTGVCDDVDADPTVTTEEAVVIAGAGFRAYVAVPLLKAGSWVAVLAVHSIAPRAWFAGEVALVEETAERTWSAVARARSEDALRQSEEKYPTSRRGRSSRGSAPTSTPISTPRGYRTPSRARSIASCRKRSPMSPSIAGRRACPSSSNAIMRTSMPSSRTMGWGSTPCWFQSAAAQPTRTHPASGCSGFRSA